MFTRHACNPIILLSCSRKRINPRERVMQGEQEKKEKSEGKPKMMPSTKPRQ